MDLPGASIFQGAGNIQLNTSAQRQQEEEEFQEQKIRNEKIQNELLTAFDDLSDNEDDTIATENHSHQNRSSDPATNNDIFINHHQQFMENNFPTTEQQKLIMNMNHMKNALNSKSREVVHVNNTLQEIQKKFDSQINELKKKFALSEAEKERAHMTRKQTHELLVESKTKISEQENTISELKQKIKTLETAKTDLATKLEHTQTILSDVQHKYHLVERNAGFNATKQADQLLKQAQERHSAQIDMMQQQIDGLHNAIEAKESELNMLDVRYKELQRSREALLIDKSETINQLSKTLEESQKQCQLLMARGDLTPENIRLKNLVDSLHRQTEDMQKTITNLTNRLTDTSTSNRTNIEYETLASPDQFSKMQKTHGPASSSTPYPANATTDRISCLKTELNRCMVWQKEKREEIKKLEEQLSAKNVEIKRLKDDENSALVQMMAYKDESARLSVKLKYLQIELEKQTNNTISDSGTLQLTLDIRRLESENKQLQYKVDDLTQDLKNLQNEYTGLESKYDELKAKSNQIMLLDEMQSECDRLKRDSKELTVSKELIVRELNEMKECQNASSDTKRIQSLEQELYLNEVKCNEFKTMLSQERLECESMLNDMKIKYENDIKSQSQACQKCSDQMAKFAKFEVETHDLENKCTKYLNEIQMLHGQLEQQQSIIDELNQKMQLKDEHDKLLDELKQKASKFENYIKNQSPQNATASDQCNSPSMNIVSTDGGSSSDLENELKLRQQSAKILATQIKSIEEKFKHKTQEHVNEIERLRRGIDELKCQLQIRTSEVDLLKQAILSEREKMSEILREKDEKSLKIFTQQKQHIEQIQLNLDRTNDRVQGMQKEMIDRQDQFSGELKSMEMLIGQCENEKETLRRKEEQLKQHVLNVESDHMKAVEHLTAKYKSAKKIAANYKKYAEDKDKHIAAENERIKLAYDAAVKKIQQKAEEKIRKKLTTN